MAGTLGREVISTRQRKIAELAQREPKLTLTTLAHHVDEVWMREAYRRIRKDAAAGGSTTTSGSARGVRSNAHSYRNWEPRVGNCPRPPSQNHHRVVRRTFFVLAVIVRTNLLMTPTSRGERYFCTEAEARAAGSRRGKFVPPRDGRRGERLTAATRDAPRVSAGERGGCKIKGNISHNSGRRIYHMPGGRDYERTRISTSRGERYFCTEAEARAAGSRRAGR